MDLQAISLFLNSNGLAVLIIIALGYGGYKLLMPYLKRKLENNVANDGVVANAMLANNVHEHYFKIMDDTRASNDKILEQLEKINYTNTEISKTNTELSLTNRKLVESYDLRFSAIEESVQDINHKVDGIVNVVGGNKNL
jgi:hypothetical protein